VRPAALSTYSDIHAHGVSEGGRAAGSCLVSSNPQEKVP
jgi:hypothetical protein